MNVDKQFNLALKRIEGQGKWSEAILPEQKEKYRVLYIKNQVYEFDLAKQFPITSLREVEWKPIIKFMLREFQDNTDIIKSLENTGKYAGERKKGEYFFLYISDMDGETYLNGFVGQDYCNIVVNGTPGGVSTVRYAALISALANHFGWKVGELSQMVHILYREDRPIHVNYSKTLRSRYKRNKHFSKRYPKLVLKVPNKTSFYALKADDFEILDYHPIEYCVKRGDVRKWEKN